MHLRVFQGGLHQRPVNGFVGENRASDAGQQNGQKQLLAHVQLHFRLIFLGDANCTQPVGARPECFHIPERS